MASIGYARVSTGEQTTEGQIDALKAAGCTTVFTENGSGGDPKRPVLANTIASLRKGDTLVVVRIDRLARSVVHLLEIIDSLQKRGISFRSLSDPIDTTSPQGRFTLQILGSVAEFERALIRERTVAGMAVSRKNGKKAGNPGLRRRDPEAIAKIVAAGNAQRQEAVNRVAPDIVPIITALRPTVPWDGVAEILNQKGIPTPFGNAWQENSIFRVTRRLVSAGLLDASVLKAAPRRKKPDHLLLIVSGIVRMNPNATLDQIGENLRAIRQVTPKGSSTWSKASVKSLIDQARARGLIPQIPADD